MESARSKEYPGIEKFEEDIYPLRKAQFRSERLIFAELAELILESSKPLGLDLPDDSGVESELLMLVSRMFDDCESAKQLLLHGLPEQVPPLLRDAVECTLLARLFQSQKKAAKKWVANLAQYSPTEVKRRLEELGIEAPELVLYGLLSHTAHANLLGLLIHVREDEVGESGVRRTYHFGGCTGGKIDEYTRAYFALMFFVMVFALDGPLANLRELSKEGVDEWRGRLAKNKTLIQGLAEEVAKNWGGKPVRREFQVLVAKRLRLNSTR